MGRNCDSVVFSSSFGLFHCYLIILFYIWKHRFYLSHEFRQKFLEIRQRILRQEIKHWPHLYKKKTEHTENYLIVSFFSPLLLYLSYLIKILALSKHKIIDVLIGITCVEPLRTWNKSCFLSCILTISAW